MSKRILTIIVVLMTLTGTAWGQQPDGELPRIVKDEADVFGSGMGRLSYYYRSVDPLHVGDSITLSGAIFVPNDIYDRKKTAAGIILLNHPTVMRRNEAPTTYESHLIGNTIEGNIISLEKDYIMVCADYYGFGVTETIDGVKQPQTYLYADCTARHVLDALENAVLLLKKEGYSIGNVLVNMGYSQGAHTSMAALKTVVNDSHYGGVKFDYTMCGGGPYDLQAFYSELMKANKYAYPVAVGMLMAYTHQIERAQGNADFANITLGDLFDEAMLPKMDDLFYNGDYGASFTNRDIFILYGESSTLDVKKMISSGMKDTNSAVFKAFDKVLVKNSLTSGWVPREEDKIYLFHSSGDEIVYKACSDNLVKYFQSQGIEVGTTGSGKNVTYGSLPFLSHETGIVLFLFTALNTLNNLQEEATGIVNVNVKPNLNDNGNLNRIYNLGGQRLKTPQKGINIINGRKVLIK